MAWWNQPLRPEDVNPVSQPEPEHEEELLTEEGKRKAWRLLSLLNALRELRPQEPVSLDEIEQLGRVAAGNHDLHAACDALRKGCGLDRLADIFT